MKRNSITLLFLIPIILITTNPLQISYTDNPITIQQFPLLEQSV